MKKLREILALLPEEVLDRELDGAAIIMVAGEKGALGLAGITDEEFFNNVLPAMVKDYYGAEVRVEFQGKVN